MGIKTQKAHNPHSTPAYASRLNQIDLWHNDSTHRHLHGGQSGTFREVAAIILSGLHCDGHMPLLPRVAPRARLNCDFNILPERR